MAFSSTPTGPHTDIAQYYDRTFKAGIDHIDVMVKVVLLPPAIAADDQGRQRQSHRTLLNSGERSHVEAAKGWLSRKLKMFSGQRVLQMADADSSIPVA
jgi:hypothetical protein